MGKLLVAAVGVVGVTAFGFWSQDAGLRQETLLAIWVTCGIVVVASALRNQLIRYSRKNLGISMLIATIVGFVAFGTIGALSLRAYVASRVASDKKKGEDPGSTDAAAPSQKTQEQSEMTPDIHSQIDKSVLARGWTLHERSGRFAVYLIMNADLLPNSVAEVLDRSDFTPPEELAKAIYDSVGTRTPRPVLATSPIGVIADQEVWQHVVHQFTQPTVVTWNYELMKVGSNSGIGAKTPPAQQITVTDLSVAAQAAISDLDGTVRRLINRRYLDALAKTEPPPKKTNGPVVTENKAGAKYPADELPRRRTELFELRACITDAIEPAATAGMDFFTGDYETRTGYFSMDHETPRQFAVKLEAFARRFKAAVASCQTVLDRYGHADMANLISPLPTMERPINVYVYFLRNLDDKPIPALDIRRQVFDHLECEQFRDGLQEVRTWIEATRKKLDQKASEYR